MLDRPTVKAWHAPRRGGYEQTKGWKRHIAVDTDGRLLMVDLTTADIQVAVGAERFVEAACRRWPC